MPPHPATQIQDILEILLLPPFPNPMLCFALYFTSFKKSKSIMSTSNSMIKYNQQNELKRGMQYEYNY